MYKTCVLAAQYLFWGAKLPIKEKRFISHTSWNKLTIQKSQKRVPWIDDLNISLHLSRVHCSEGVGTYLDPRLPDIWPHYLSIYLWLYSPFVGPWPLFSDSKSIDSRYGSLDEWSARHKTATNTESNTNTEYIHTDFHRLSGIRIH
jgi:hypothetical protein